MINQGNSQHQENGGFFYRTEGDNNVHFLTKKLLAENKITILADFKRSYQDNVTNSQQDLTFILRYKSLIAFCPIEMLTTSEKEPVIVATKCLNFRIQDEIDDYFLPEADLQPLGIKRRSDLESYFQLNINHNKEPLELAFKGFTQKKETLLISIQTTRSQPIWTGIKYIKKTSRMKSHKIISLIEGLILLMILFCKKSLSQS